MKISIKVLDKIVSNKEEISEETDYELIKKEIKELRTLIHRNVNGTSGGGEVRLEFLDDVDRDSAKVDGKLLKYRLFIWKMGRRNRSRNYIN